MSPLEAQDEQAIRELVLRLISRELPAGSPLPRDDEDFVKGGTIDSMGWVGILSGIEEATGIRNFGASWPENRAQSVRNLVDAVREQLSKTTLPSERSEMRGEVATDVQAAVTGWAYRLGSRRVDAAEIEREYGLPAGTIVDGAGIRSVSRADDAETEVTLGAEAAESALDTAGVGPDEADMVVATSATWVGFPSLAALLHSRLLLRETCVALDLGGACVGVIHALAIAKALLAGSRRRVALVVASEVNSRRLSGPGVPGEFRGLFGDGACAFVLTRSDSPGRKLFRAGEFVSGCSGAFSSTLQIAVRGTGELEVAFKGEQLANAAIATLNQIVGSLEDLCGVARSDVACFAFHEPNPRLVEILTQRAKIPAEKVTRIAETCGNLGSVTCGVNLCTALTRLHDNPHESKRRVIFVAAVGPGLVWGGTYFT